MINNRDIFVRVLSFNGVLLKYNIAIKSRISVQSDIMDDFFFFPQINEEKNQKSTMDRLLYAQNFYQSLRKCNKVTQDKKSEPSSQEGLGLQGKEVIIIEDKDHFEEIFKGPVTNEHALIILQGLSSGNNIKKTRMKNPILQNYSMQQLKNVPRVTLLKLSKIFIELLPEKITFLKPIQLYQKYFRTIQMLKFYKDHHLNLIPTFQDLLFIKNWQKKNNEYLKRGYARDYLPSEITSKLLQLPRIYEEMIFIYDKFGFKLKSNQRWKRKDKDAKLSQFSFAQEATRTGLQQMLQSKSNQQQQIF